MSDSTQNILQIKKAVVDAMEFLTEEKLEQLIVDLCVLIKTQRNEMQQTPESTEVQALSACGITDGALAEQEKVLEEMIVKDRIERANKLDFDTFQNR